MPKAALSLAKKSYLAISILGLSGVLVLNFIPQLMSGGAQPPVYIYLLGGLVGVGITAAILALVRGYEPVLKRRLLWLVFAYNAFIVLVKLLVVPFGLYQYNAGTEFTTQFDDPNSFLFYVFSGVFVFFLYALVWWLIYRFYSKRTAALLAGPKAAVEWVGMQPASRARKWLAHIVAGILIAAVLYFTGIWGFIFIFGFGTLDYFNLLTSSGIILPVAASLLAAILLAVGAFRQAEHDAVELKDATVLASLFWLGLALIAVYHVMWIVFMVALVTSWPFNTYTPK